MYRSPLLDRPTITALTIAAVCLGSSFAYGQAKLPNLGDMTEQQLQALQTELTKERARRSSLNSKSKAAGSATARVPPGGRSFDEFSYDPNYSRERLFYENRAYSQNFYIRSDPLDSFAYLYPFTPLDGKGASVSFTDNRLNHTQSLTLKGYTSYVVTRNYTQPTLENFGFFGYAVGAFAFADGTLNNPFKASERNALQLGLDNQIAFSGGLFPIHNFGLRPYYQTDYRGQAGIYGLSALYEPVDLSLNLGARLPQPQILGVLWRVLPELNAFHVDDPGRTNFSPHRDYTFVGGTLQTRMVLFEKYEGVDPFWRDRFYLNGSVTQFWDVSNRGKPFHDAELEAGFKLTRDPATPTGASSPTSSISVVYNNGTNRLTYEKRDQYKVQLNLQY